MNLSDEIKAALTLTKKKRKDLAQYLGLARPQALNTKFSRNSWTSDDLIKIAAFLDGDLIFKYADREIKLTEKHLEQSK